MSHFHSFLGLVNTSTHPLLPSLFYPHSHPCLIFNCQYFTPFLSFHMCSTIPPFFKTMHCEIRGSHVIHTPSFGAALPFTLLHPYSRVLPCLSLSPSSMSPQYIHFTYSLLTLYLKKSPLPKNYSFLVPGFHLCCAPS